MYKQKEDKSYISKLELEESMIALMGGRAAEDIIIGDITTGASNDIERATKIARNMIIFYGMSEKIGPISLSVDNLEEIKIYGNDITAEIGKEVREKVETAFIKAKEILNDNIDVLHELAQTLLSKEKINEKEFRSIIDKYVSRPEKEPYKSEILRKENDKLLNEMENQEKIDQNNK